MTSNTRDTKKDVIGEKCIKDGKGNLAFIVADKLKVWKQHYNCLVNINWDENSPSDVKSKTSAPTLFTSEMVVNAANQMHKCIAPGSYWVLIEIMKTGDAIIADVFMDIVNLVIPGKTCFSSSVSKAKVMT